MSLFDDDVVLETTKTLRKTNVLKRESKRSYVNALKQEKVNEFLKELPKKGESIHIVSNGSFDFYSFIPIVIKFLGGSISQFYGSTWTMNRGNVLDLLSMFDKKQIKEIFILTGLYFKRRESAVYAQIAEGLIERKQRFICLENHSKITLFENGTDFIVIEGSANFTSNPRIEQFCITNDKELFDFHKNWMDNILNDK